MRFDVVAVGDLTFPGGTSSALAHEIRALHGAGYTVGLLHKRAPILKRNRPIHHQIRACLDAGLAALIAPGKVAREVAADLVVLHNPYVFTQPQPGLPRISARHKVMVAHQPLLDSSGVPYYDVATVDAVAADLVGAGVRWAPISPLSRAKMLGAGFTGALLDDDWIEVIYVEDWAAKRDAPVGAKPVIGRHSRPEREKWPATREEMLAVYPAGDEFDVRLLGVGDALKAIVGEPMPANWTTYEFDEITPAEFLRGIDFFVYYHHHDWVEGFGRTIAEAIASGAVAILPEHFRPTFGEAALYRAPADVIETVRQFHADWESYRLQSRLGQVVIDRKCGPQVYVDRIAALIGPRDAEAPAAAPRPAAADAADVQRSAIAVAASFDVLHLGDLQVTGDDAWRIANEARIAAESGYKAGLLHLATRGEDRLPVIHPVIDGLVREGAARAVDPASGVVTAKLLIVSGPAGLLRSVLEGDGLAMPRIIADTVIVMAEQGALPEDVMRQDALLRSMFGAGVTWVTSDPQQRQALARGTRVLLEEEPWRPSIAAFGWSEPHQTARVQPVIGRVEIGGSGQWPEDEAQTLAVYPARPGGAVVRVMSTPSCERPPLPAIPDAWEVCGIADMNPWKFLSGLDFLVYYPGRSPSAIPLHAIAWAMAHGIPAILPRSLEPIFKRGPIYAAPDEVIGLVTRLYSDRAQLAAVKADMSRQVRHNFGAAVHKARLRRLVGHAARPPRAPSRRRVLFMSSNGVGLGHLTRLLAIARRLPGTIEPVFATMSQAASVVEQAGYPCEFLPFHTYANCDPDDWNEWLRLHLTQIIDFHRADAVVFDGGMPYGGLIKAVAPRRDVKLIWVRRGMWRAEQANDEAIRRQRFFDLIIEPSDIAEAMDRGATAANRSTVLKVAPISLLEPDELLDRAAAAARLGLDPARPAVLIQLGSGWNRDLASIVDAILKTLARRPQVQTMLAEWMMASTPLDLWPGVARLRGFPITKFYNAFDFTISAAGYNSFNEIMSFGLPAIFAANEHAMLDDQGGRATFAEENGAALRLPDDPNESIEPMVDAMLDEKVRWLIKMNCSRLAQGNGAGVAAEAIARLAASE